MLLDLSASFDSVDHATMLRQFSGTYGLAAGGAILNCFRLQFLRSYAVRPLRHVQSVM